MHYTRFAPIVLLCLALFFVTTVLMPGIVGFEPRASAQSQKGAKAHSAEGEGVFREYKGVTLGMNTDEARKKLGKPTEQDDEQDYFVFSDTESAQIYYDKEHTVTALSVNYVGQGSGVPNAKDVLGTEVAAKPDGSMHHLVRFPKDGFWISYSRTSGDAPIVTVTLKKL
jgi:hypothetical protein